MIKKILIEYCDANEKYYSFVDGIWTGKWYDLSNCLEQHIKKIKLEEIK